MVVYQTILLAVDLHQHCDTVTMQRALQLAASNNAQIHVVHAVEHINAYGMAQAYPTVIDLEAQMLTEAQLGLSRFAAEYAIPAARQSVAVGSPKNVILNKAAELKADLIIVGAHGRHGISLLLGSTANAVIHHAQRDVLAVWIPGALHA